MKTTLLTIGKREKDQASPGRMWGSDKSLAVKTAFTGTLLTGSGPWG